MSTPLVLCENFTLFNKRTNPFHHNHPNSALLLTSNTSNCSTNNITRRGLSRLIPNANNNNNKRSGNRRAWWKNFFLDEDANWLGLKEEEMLEDDSEIPNEGEKFEAWKRRAEAITELRQAQEDAINEENQKWEDWLVEEPSQLHESSWSQDWEDGLDKRVQEIREDPSEMMPEKGLVKSLRDIVLGKEDDDLLYEDRVFQYASSNSAKFLALLVVIPWSLDFVVHDFVLMPFLDRYVKLVPLAAELLDVRRPQKLEMVKTLKVEKARLRFEVEIGKAPPLSDEEAWLELRHRALELRDEWRLENRKAFANIWSDMVFGIAVFILLYFNQSKVALLKFTGYKIINNVTDTGKAFLIILITDIFLGYHSESGWQTLLEILVEHYGLEVDQSAITVFICLVPVLMDACVKLWLFKFLPRLSPKVSNIFREMKRH